jgi:hypothetical protein
VESVETGSRQRTGASLPRPHWPRDALEVLRSEVLKLKQIADELSGTFGNHSAVRLRNALQARGKVRRLADDATLLSLSGADQIANNNQPVAMPTRA